ncbi:excisionase family DNA-binding protein [Singulisphaera acidiphila]|uniref:DNA-binding protein, excisionase family n=1 Tax=Singulisphaera acidiphila (strain ATCC BAA-1392 / DSM 18658 / VKM B-2454 / MOB10) TaxID=886293 RepID=L0DIT5_SINAD|nr:helix-turn-helix domain-containing protein [Singulisphaera acidiphila]AGA28728.1 DNA-binding protein, excisionase family [Singulisphaera acidiphila DSM 18658]
MTPEVEPQRSPYATVQEAAGYTRVSTRTIRRAITSGRLTAHRVGVRVLIRYADLDTFVTAGGESPPASTLLPAQE